MDVIKALASKCRIATPHDTVLNSECAFTFHNPYTSPKGIVVNLTTFIGSVDEMAFSSSKNNNNDNDEAFLFLRIVKQRVPKSSSSSSSSNSNNEDNIDKDDEDITQRVTKLGVGIEGGFQSESEMFETKSSYSIVVIHTQLGVQTELPYTEETKHDFPMQVTMSADSIIHHSGLAVQQDLKAWELDDEPKPVSKYVETLAFVDNGVQISPNPADWKCEKSGDTQNLWLNLSDGFIGGGRKNWDGSGGSNGALDHFLETGEKYPLVVKLGTITEDLDTADCYSYAKDEDGPVKIPNLKELLVKRGIHVAGMQKTVKSTAELEVELNATYAFDAITEAGTSLIPLSGPGLQGLQNLGNSCYINSIVQLLFGGTIPELTSRYGIKVQGDVTSNSLLKISPPDAPLDLLCQTSKLCSALTSGCFAGPVPESAVVTDASTSSSLDPKYRLPPRMFKHVIGKDHVDFRTGQQQDAAQYLQYLLEKLDTAEVQGKDRFEEKNKDESEGFPTTSKLFSFRTTSRLVCLTDNRVKYKNNETDIMLRLAIPMDKAWIQTMEPDSEPDEKRLKSDSNEDTKENDVPTVTFKACVDSWSSSNHIDDIRWPHLNNMVSPAVQSTRFSNFPRYLIIQIQRYELGPDWTPKKIDVNIDMPEEIDLNTLKFQGPQDGEDIISDDEGNGNNSSSAEAEQVKIDDMALSQLVDIGFGVNGCKRALMAVGGSNVEAAMNWIFEHNNDADFNEPLPETTSTNSNPTSINEGIVSDLVENLGCFTADQVRVALKKCDGAADLAADWLFSNMDDLDNIVQSEKVNSTTTTISSEPQTSSLPNEDGDGKYSLVGMVSHIGKNTSSGHYVAHVKKNGKWVIFNDEKVAQSEKPPTPHAYLYFFQRTDTIGSPNISY
jgi:ubiquitin carboxyl-terminal hydrolase 5/13